MRRLRPLGTLLGCINHVKITGTCKYSCKTLGYGLGKIVNSRQKCFMLPVPGIYRASYQGCGGYFREKRILPCLVLFVLYFSQRNHEERYDTRGTSRCYCDVFVMNGERKVPRRCHREQRSYARNFNKKKRLTS